MANDAEKEEKSPEGEEKKSSGEKGDFNNVT